MSAVLLYVTAPDRASALTLADRLLSEKLAACVNIFPEIHSLYIWQGKREESREVALIAKTTQAKAEAAVECLRRTHPYECPCIVTLPISGGHAPFLEWIGREVGEG